MIDTIEMTVVTPMMMPRMVREERSLCAARAPVANRTFSRTANNLSSGRMKKLFPDRAVIRTSSLTYAPALDTSSRCLSVTVPSSSPTVGHAAVDAMSGGLLLQFTKLRRESL